MAKNFEDIKKFNPYHGADGRFTTGSAATSFTYKPGASKAHDNAIAREKERSKKMGGPIIGSIKSYSELESAVKDLGFKSGITDAVKKKINIECASKYLDGVASVAKDFPEIKKNFTKVDCSPNGIASTNGSSIFMNPQKMGSVNKVNDIVNACTVTGYWPKNSTIESIGAHEAGHCVENAIIEENGLFGYEAAKAFNKGTYSKAIVTQACKDIKKTAYGKGKKNDELLNGISGQARARSRQEAFAEAFADVHANGDNANPLSRKIVQLARQELDKAAAKPKSNGDDYSHLHLFNWR